MGWGLEVGRQRAQIEVSLGFSFPPSFSVTGGAAKLPWLLVPMALIVSSGVTLLRPRERNAPVGGFL